MGNYFSQQGRLEQNVSILTRRILEKKVEFNGAHVDIVEYPQKGFSLVQIMLYGPLKNQRYTEKHVFFEVSFN